jgi:hypothetical protein
MSGRNRRERPIHPPLGRQRRSRLPDVSLGLVLVVASASVFGPLSGWLAGQRMRNIALWGVFGIILGPIAPALLLSAPPGRCAACRWPVAGWGGRCAACGADVRTGASMTTDASVTPASGGLAGAATALGASEPASGAREVPGRPAALPSGAPVVALATRTGSSAPSAPSDRAGHTSAASPAGHRQPTVTRTDGDWAPRVRPTELGRQPVEAPPVGRIEPADGEPPSDAIALLGSGVYVGGNRRFQTGNRYLLARVLDELQILGPVHLDPAAIADRMPLEAIEAFVLEEQLIIEGRDKRTDISMSFVAVSLQPGVDIQAELGTPRTAAPTE